MLERPPAHVAGSATCGPARVDGFSASRDVVDYMFADAPENGKLPWLGWLALPLDWTVAGDDL